MLAKFIIIAITAEALLTQNEATTSCVRECPQWVRLNSSPVCFGAKDDQFGPFSYSEDIAVSQFMLVYRSGAVSCREDVEGTYWGCNPDQNPLGALLTDQENLILAPQASKVNDHGWYSLEGYTTMTPALVFCTQLPCHPVVIPANSELRLWYGEDLRGFTEDDNSGETCADVYALVALTIEQPTLNELVMSRKLEQCSKIVL